MKLCMSRRSSPQAISHAFPSASYFPRFALRLTLSSLPSRSFTTELSPSYFPRFPLRPPCRRFHFAPFPRSSPRAISRSFPSVHPVVASILLPPNGALPELFPTASPPSTPSLLRYRFSRGKVTQTRPSIGDAFGNNVNVCIFLVKYFISVRKVSVSGRTTTGG